MNFLADRQNKKDLQLKLDEQAIKIQRYETKLSDLVKAYKRLQAERDTLDETVKVLAGQKEPQDDSESQGNQENPSDPEAGSSTLLDTEDTRQTKISTLTNALATLRVEKTHSEQAFHADKKRLLQEKLELTKTLETIKKEIDEKQQILLQTQAKLSDEKQFRQREAADHLAMMKELQKKLAEERFARDIIHKDNLVKWEQKCQTLEAQISLLKDLQEERNEKSQPTTDINQNNDEVIRDLESRAAKDAARANLAEEKLSHFQTTAEERIALLEAQVEELSATVAYYDRMHQQAQETLQSLREELAKAQAKNKVAAIYSAIEEESNHDVSSLLNTVGRSFSMLASANQRSQDSITDLALEINRLLNKHAIDVHKRCAQDVQDIKQEFGSYKELHNASCLKIHRQISSSTSDDFDKVAKLTSQLVSKKQEYSEAIASLNHTVRELQLSIVDLKTKHRQELTQLEASWRSRLTASEESMARQRERSMQLLSERDAEDVSYTGNPQQAAQLLATISKQQQRNQERASVSSNGKVADEDSMLAELFSLSKSTALGAGGAKIEMLHYTHEIARKTAEVQQLIKEKKELEMKTYQQQSTFGDKERQYKAEIDALNRTVELQKSCSTLKELEKPYLKNVILQYMLCPSSGPRLHMVKAISTALEFTADEEEQVKQALHRKRLLSTGK